MKAKKMLILNILMFCMMLSNCSAISMLDEDLIFINRDNDTFLSAPTLYLPVVTKHYPYISIFGVESNKLENLNKVYDLGVNLLRGFIISWDVVQPDNNLVYQWDKVSGLEERLRLASSMGFTPILVIMHAPEWARKYDYSRCGPISENKTESFSNFVVEVVKRYSQPPYNVKYYQIWNEPDAPVSTSSWFGCWGEENYPGDPFFGGEFYGRVLKNVYSSVKSFNTSVYISPGALLLDCDPRGVGNGFCSSQEWAKKNNFFEGVVKSAGDSFDFVAFNAYPYYTETGEQNSPVWKEKNRHGWWKNGGVVDGKISYLQEVMHKYGIEKPLIITEAGLLYSDQPFPNDTVKEDYERQKADYIAWVYANAWSKGVKGVIWYSFEGWRKTELFRDGQELPAFQALKTMTSFLKYADYINREDNTGFTKFIYRNGNEIIWLLIPTGQQYGTAYTILAPSKLKRVVDLFGNEQTISGQSINFTRPTYVFINP